MKARLVTALSGVLALTTSLFVPLPPTSEASQDCTPSPGYTHCVRLSYTGSDQTFTVPASFPAGGSLIVEVWGAAGGGAGYGSSSYQAGGGGGGYSKTEIQNTNAGDVFTVVVGQGGALVANPNSLARTHGYGGGARPGTTDGGGTTAGAGGGLSGVFRDIAKTQPLVISGGGGGASPGINPSTISNSGFVGGGGGGNAAASTGGTWAGRPGTLAAGGIGGGCGAQAGSQYLGGFGANTGEPGGGGGGGYFGGGGGSCQVVGSDQNGGGGSGSGFVDASVVVLESGNGTIGDAGSAPSDPGVAGIPATVGRVLHGAGGQYLSGIGASTVNGAGGNGMVVFQWSLPPAATPSTVNDVVLSPYMGTTSFTPLANDLVTRTESGYSSVGTSSLDGNSLRLCAPNQTVDNCNETVVNTAAGSYTLDASTQSVTFQAQTGFIGQDPDAPNYKVCVGFTGTWVPTPPDRCALGNISLTVDAAPAPTAASDSATGIMGATLSVNVTSNDSAATGLTLASGSVRLCQDLTTAAASCNLTSLAATGGNLTLDTNTGIVTFTPSSGFFGVVEVDYSIADSNSTRAKGRIEFEILATPANPSLTADSFVGLKNVAVTGSVVTNDVLPAGGTIVLETNVGSGQLSFASDGAFVFTPVNDFVGDVSFSYKVCNPAPHAHICSIETVTISVSEPVAPTTVDDNFAGSNSATITGNVLANDTYQVGTTVTVSGQPSNGSVVIQANGDFVFTPDVGFVGAASFSYQACLAAPHQSVCGTADVVIDVSAAALVAPNTPAVVESAVVSTSTVSGLPVTLQTGASGTSDQFCLVDLVKTECTDKVTVEGTGEFELQTTGEVTFTPEITFTGDASIPLRQIRNGAVVKESLLLVSVTSLAGDQTITKRGAKSIEFPTTLVASSESCLVQDASASCDSEIRLSGVGIWTLNSDMVLVFEPTRGFVGKSVVWLRVTAGNAVEFQRFEAVVVSKRPPVRLVLKNFVDGSPELRASFKERIAEFVTKYSDYRVMACTGYTEGPTILSSDPQLALDRATNVCNYAQGVQGIEFELVPPRGLNETQVADWVRRAVITLRD